MLTVPGTAVHMEDVASQPAAIAYLERTWIPGSHGAVRAVRVKGRWFWRIDTWPTAASAEQPKELAA